MAQARPFDLTAFLRALELSGERLDPDEIALVETAWEIPDTVVSSHGWVLAMKGGRRVYVEYTIDITAGLDEELTFRELQLDEPYPTLDDDAGVVWYRPDHINRHLRITVPPLH